MSAIDDIAAERIRQIEKEGWTQAHDDEHATGEMALAASTYAYAATLSEVEARFHQRRLTQGLDRGFFSVVCHLWPWGGPWFKVSSKRRMLVKAGALIVAEIERLDRAKAADDAESLRIAKAC